MREKEGMGRGKEAQRRDGKARSKGGRRREGGRELGEKGEWEKEEQYGERGWEKIIINNSN